MDYFSREISQLGSAYEKAINVSSKIYRFTRDNSDVIAVSIFTSGFLTMGILGLISTINQSQ